MSDRKPQWMFPMFVLYKYTGTLFCTKTA